MEVLLIRHQIHIQRRYKYLPFTFTYFCNHNSFTVFKFTKFKRIKRKNVYKVKSTCKYIVRRFPRKYKQKFSKYWIFMWFPAKEAIKCMNIRGSQSYFFICMWLKSKKCTYEMIFIQTIIKFILFLDIRIQSVQGHTGIYVSRFGLKVFVSV